jgi:hypothetical protein
MRIVAVALVLAAASPSRAQTPDELGLRELTVAEDRSLAALLGGLEKLLPAPAAASWERSSGSTDLAERERQRVAKLHPEARMFDVCQGALTGCFPGDVRLELLYRQAGAEQAAAARLARAEQSDDPMVRAVAAAQELSGAFSPGLRVVLEVHGAPAYQGCLSGEGSPRAVERRADFLHEEYVADDGEASARLVFGARDCAGEPPRRAGPGAPLAPVRAIVVDVSGPVADVRQLLARVDRKAFTARVGPVPAR